MWSASFVAATTGLDNMTEHVLNSQQFIGRVSIRHIPGRGPVRFIMTEAGLVEATATGPAVIQSAPEVCWHGAMVDVEKTGTLSKGILSQPRDQSPEEQERSRSWYGGYDPAMPTCKEFEAGLKRLEAAVQQTMANVM
jgi:hypothetical protein